jgi:phage terminase small subunit
MSEKALTMKQQMFVSAYLVSLNATQAAIQAGYAPKRAYAMGHENLKKPEIAKAIERAMSERSEKTQINAEWMLRRLEQDSAADIADLYDEAGNIRPVREWPKAFRTGLVAGVETVQLGEAGEITVKKVKLVDRAKYLEMIGRHIDVGAFKDRVEVDVVDSLAARLERVRAKRAAK